MNYQPPKYQLAPLYRRRAVHAGQEGQEEQCEVTSVRSATTVANASTVRPAVPGSDQFHLENRISCAPLTRSVLRDLLVHGWGGCAIAGLVRCPFTGERQLPCSLSCMVCTQFKKQSNKTQQGKRWLSAVVSAGATGGSIFCF